VTTDKEKQLAWTQIAVHTLTQPYVDRITSNVWLTWGGLLLEMEGFMCASQDQWLTVEITEIHYKLWQH
jgi:hypothetical protein